jgi:hypothetical protein
MNPPKQTNDRSPFIVNEPASKGMSSIFGMNSNATNVVDTDNSSPRETFSPLQQSSSFATSFASILTPSKGMSSYIQYGVIIIIISLLGLNVFGFLENIVETVTEIIRPVAAFFGYTVGETIKGAISTGAAGTKGIIDVASGTITGGVDILEKGLNNKNRHNRNKIDNSFLDQSVPNNDKPEESPEPDESGSRTQTKSTGKSGYCYIGEDRGFRNCIEVGENDKCMSGDIFPSQEICINPNLRE